tara:strand:+ start:5874 stop:6209 length:336 start_codon:yes stop_codon:yes gene_type:complete
MKLLTDLGFSEVSRLYVEECGSVRALCEMLFEPRRPGEKVGVSSFYDWIRTNGYRPIWRETVRLREKLLKNTLVKAPPDFEWPFWQVSATFEAYGPEWKADRIKAWKKETE